MKKDYTHIVLTNSTIYAESIIKF